MTEKWRYYAKALFLLALIVGLIGGSVYINQKTRTVAGAGCIVNGQTVRTCGQ